MSRALPTLVAPGAGDPGLLDVPGAFDWWYLDLVDADGNGAVVVASFGLPMVPLGLEERRRTPPRALPALVVSEYRRGRPGLWSFQTFAPEEAGWDGPERWFGRHRFRLSLGADTVGFRVSLDGRTGHAGFRGVIEGEGPLRRGPAGPATADHAWCLLSAGAQGTVDLSVEGRRVRVRGSAYLDRNAGVAPLADLGVERWVWGRLGFPSGTLVWYASGADARVWWIAADGAAEGVSGSPVSAGRRRGRWLLVHPASLRVPGPSGPVDVALGVVVEDGPFYRRFVVRADVPGLGVGLGFAEWAEQGAMDRSPLLPLVRMAVDRGPASSVWLPLLVGPPETRVRRFLRGAA